jgi:hypothetical protein
MDAIHANITDARKVELLFETFPDVLYSDLRVEVDALTLELLARIESVTPDRTGALRSQERARLFTDPNRITGQIDIAGTKGSQDFAKAGALEYGAHRATKVAAHSMKLDHYWSTKLAEPEMVMVDAYTRTPDIAEYAFERGPLAEMAPEIIARLEAVVAKAATEANG